MKIIHREDYVEIIHREDYVEIIHREDYVEIIHREDYVGRISDCCLLREHLISSQGFLNT